MSWAGWLTMLAAVGGATALFAWCLWKVLSTPQATERLHGVPDTEPRDQREG
ncbi:MAG: hypothetical protein RMM29_03935 [Planctomycetota bacterium]|nr:hypothetical protein [Planctomycetota bacterium]MCX8038963.1 hypothetical protein [Planctomycetota bacterium]MDW8372786.1 hypothetical protein [Planctomycetota bacterium]